MLALLATQPAFAPSRQRLTQRASLRVWPTRRAARGLVVPAAAASDGPPPAAPAAADEGTAQASSRQVARQQRVREQAEEVERELQLRRYAARFSSDAAARQQVVAVAASLLEAGMSRPAGVDFMLHHPGAAGAASLDPARLAPKLASARAFVRGEAAAAPASVCWHHAMCAAMLPAIGDATSPVGDLPLCSCCHLLQA